MECEEFPDVMPDSAYISRRWYWKEDTCTLEQTSGPGTAYDKVSPIIKAKRAKAATSTVGNVHFQQDTNFRTRMSPGGAQSVGKANRRSSIYGNQSRSHPSPRTSSKAMENTLVTLKDVKNAAYDKTAEDSDVSRRFQRFLDTEQLDEFLAALLVYFETHFERIAIANKPKPMATEPSSSEVQEMSSVCVKESTLQKILAKHYSGLILCLGIEDLHHMSCGRQRKSTTETDRKAFENLYTFLAFTVWIAFRRQYYELIAKELGMLFRSNTFNPTVTQVKENDFKLASDLTKEKNPKIKLSTKTRSQMMRRPAIQSIVNQRSPVLTALLPTPRDVSPWLLDRSKSSSWHDTKASTRDHDEMEDLLPPSSLLKVGIIGEPMVGFNQVTLAPFGDDHDENEDKDPLDNDTPVSHDRSHLQSGEHETLSARGDLALD